MKKVLFSSICVMLYALCASVYAATEQQKLDAGMVNPGYIEKPAWFKLSLLELQDDVAEASAAGKRLILYFYQDGCPYCEKLIVDNFGNKEIADKAKKNFDMIALNMWGDKEVIDLQGKETIEKDFAAAMKVMYTPTMLFLDEKGQVALRLNGYYFPEKFNAVLDYVAAGMEAKMKFSEYYRAKTATPTTGKLHIDPSYLQPPYNLQQTLQANKRPLLVIFEQPGSKLCDELHLDILQKPESKEAIKGLDVAVLGQHSKGFVVTPDGQAMRISDWAKKLNIQYAPSLVYFDTAGKEVFRTEAYLRTFHIAGSMNYVTSGKYKTQPNFQRYLQDVNKDMISKGIKVELMR